jgi:hypothetical protein
MPEIKRFKSKVKSSGPLPGAAHGGSGHMVGKTGAGPQSPGGTTGSAHNSPSRGFAHGGSGHMLGKSGSKPRTGGKTTP